MKHAASENLNPRRGFLTYLFDDSFFPGVVALAESLKAVESKYPLACLAGPEVSGTNKLHLERLGVLVWPFAWADAIQPSSSDFLDRYRDKPHLMMTKLLVFQPRDFNELVYLDADTLVLRNIDVLFELPSFGAVPLQQKRGPDSFSSGVMRITPSQDLFDLLRSESLDPKLTRGGRGGHSDQSLLSDFFEKDMQFLGWRYNVSLKELRRNFFFAALRKLLHLARRDSNNVFENGLEGLVLRILIWSRRIDVLHFDGDKPWFRYHKGLRKSPRAEGMWQRHYDRGLSVLGKAGQGNDA